MRLTFWWLFDDFDQAQGHEMYPHNKIQNVAILLALLSIESIEQKVCVCACAFLFFVLHCYILALGNVQCILIIICNKYGMK